MRTKLVHFLSDPWMSLWAGSLQMAGEGTRSEIMNETKQTNPHHYGKNIESVPPTPHGVLMLLVVHFYMQKPLL